MQAVLDAIFPKRAICQACGDKTGLDRDWFCESCMSKFDELRVGRSRLPEGSLLNGAAHAFAYRDPAAAAVTKLKYASVFGLAGIMAADMLKAFEDIDANRLDHIVPVPMYWQRRFMRGFNQSAALARELAKLMDVPMLEALRKRRNTKQQARLKYEKRLENLQGSYAAKARLDGKSILLVDDVYTSGATAEACAEVLRSAGAKNIYLVTYAVAHPKKKT